MTPTFTLDRVNRLARFDANLPLCIAQRWLLSHGFSLPLLRPLPGSSLRQLCQRAPALVEALVHDAVLEIDGETTPLQTLSSPRAAMGPQALAATFCHPPLARMTMANVRVLPIADVTHDPIDLPRAGAGAWLLAQFQQRHGFVVDVIAVGDRVQGATIRARSPMADLAKVPVPVSLPAKRSSTFHTASALLPRATDIQQALDRGERVVAWPLWWRMAKAQPRPIQGMWPTTSSISLDAASEQLAQAMRRPS